MSAASEAATTDGLPIAPSLGPTLGIEHVQRRSRPVDRRVVLVSAFAVFVAGIAALVAQLLQHLIALCTNLAFYGRFSTEAASPANHGLGAAMIFIPVIGGLIIGVMARYGSKAIRGHGIPEAMEQVLTNESRIPPRVTFLKPLSAAISIGTGGPFGAEGPIIATGGALGSLLGQWLHVSAVERKTLLASGAAAGMAATFGSPVSAVLLAVELLLFEYRPRSLIPVALAATTATGVRIAFEGTHPAFSMPDLVQPGGGALALYVVIGAIAGLVSVGVSRSVYVIEDLFEKLPLHWMWWPALGGLAVGITGLIEPRVMGVGYDNIEALLSASWLPATVLMLCGLKFIAWSLALGSGTSGGTLAPLLTFGGGVGSLLGALATLVLPSAGVDPKLAALVGMAAMFAGASRALLASVVFAFETTRQPIGLLPLLGGCSMAFLVSALLMKNSIMTEKIERRGVRALGEYEADHLDQLVLSDVSKRAVITLNATMTVSAANAWLDSHRELRHQGYPVLSETGELLGVLTRKDLVPPENALIRSLIKRAAIVITEDASMRDAANVMAREGIGRLPVMSANNAREMVGIVTRSDLVNAHVERLDASEKRTRR